MEFSLAQINYGTLAFWFSCYHVLHAVQHQVKAKKQMFSVSGISMLYIDILEMVAYFLHSKWLG